MYLTYHISQMPYNPEAENEQLDVFFEGKLVDEKVYKIFVKHPITDLPEWFLFVVLYLFPLMILLEYTFSAVAAAKIVIWMFAPFYFVFFALFVYVTWVNDLFDLFVLTDKRLIDITQQGFLTRKTSIAELNQIQHASFKQSGVIDSVLGIGRVDVQTAGANPDIAMEWIKNPSKVTDTILTFSRNYQKTNNESAVLEGQSAEVKMDEAPGGQTPPENVA